MYSHTAVDLSPAVALLRQNRRRAPVNVVVFAPRYYSITPKRPCGGLQAAYKGHLSCEAPVIATAPRGAGLEVVGAGGIRCCVLDKEQQADGHHGHAEDEPINGGVVFAGGYGGR
ncbi:hypothetical protein CPPEL_07325 [Corynebacterium pseudopelargi]|uniref:Uncharacterized protein n=1 Tax=Corynebacterium pseudopelargi TaxID=2080757 RepID=A0A3G6IUX3_9CORY|nr:hypothetical protein CPPEL_07325 [Corynebacterium pseudopelargi]